jgi:lysophospholipase L1-like esterase
MIRKGKIRSIKNFSRLERYRGDVLAQIVIFALGDSITYGFPYGPRYSWVDMVSQKLKIKIINGGTNGDTTAFMLHRLAESYPYRPGYLLLLGGANDAYWGQPVEKYAENISEICRLCGEKEIRVILGLPTPVDEPQVEALLQDYRTFLLELSSRRDYPFIPFHQAFLDASGQFRHELTTDGCHPNLDGYEAMADLAESFLEEIIVDNR